MEILWTWTSFNTVTTQVKYCRPFEAVCKRLEILDPSKLVSIEVLLKEQFNHFPKEAYASSQRAVRKYYPIRGR